MLGKAFGSFEEDALLGDAVGTKLSSADESRLGSALCKALGDEVGAMVGVFDESTLGNSLGTVLRTVDEDALGVVVGDTTTTLGAIEETRLGDKLGSVES